jgi:tetratricopeptide (TPR) repeat protein
MRQKRESCIRKVIPSPGQELALIRSGLIAVLLTVGCAASLRAQNADSAWAAGNHELAERLFTQRLAADSNDVIALRRVATLRAWRNRYDESIALLDRAVRLAPNDTEIRLERARVLAWARRYEPAIATVDTLLARDPANRAALEARAQFTSWSGRYAESLADYGRLIDISPTDPSLQIARARVLGWARQYEQAAANYEQMLRADPNNRDALLGLAHVLSWGGRIDSAAVIFRKLVARDPRDVDALKGIARAASWSGNLREGEREWRRVLEIAPNDVEALTGLGTTLRWQGREIAAEEVLRRAIAADPNSAEARQHLAYTRAALGFRVSAAVTQEADSDDNDMTTFMITLAEFVASHYELRIQSYRRELSGPGLQGEPSQPGTWGQIFELNRHTESGWVFSAGGNASYGSGGGGLRARIVTPRWWRVAGSIAYNRAPYDYTAALALRDVVAEQVAADATTRLGQRTHVIGNVATTNFIGTESNRQLSGGLAATLRTSRWLTLGMAARAFTFEKDRAELIDGYFNPDFYGIAEFTAATYHAKRRWVVTTETAPGYQQIGSNGDPGMSFRIMARVAYALAPGKQIGLSGAYANSGLQQLSPGTTSEYNYRALSIFGSWVF